MRKFVHITDANRNDTGLRVASDTINKKTLAQDTAEKDTIPSGAKVVIISATTNIYVRCGDSTVAATIGTDVSDGSASELNPLGYYLLPEHTHISIISPAACDVTLAYYSL